MPSFKNSLSLNQFQYQQSKSSIDLEYITFALAPAVNSRWTKLTSLVTRAVCKGKKLWRSPPTLSWCWKVSKHTCAGAGRTSDSGRKGFRFSLRNTVGLMKTLCPLPQEQLLTRGRVQRSVTGGYADSCQSDHPAYCPLRAAPRTSVWLEIHGMNTASPYTFLRFGRKTATSTG